MINELKLQGLSAVVVELISVLRIRCFFDLDPDPGSGMKISYHIFKSLELMVFTVYCQQVLVLATS
jgi:hypothetical protein